jgi:uncharacterized membrane protein YebE (DUF533 family)
MKEKIVNIRSLEQALEEALQDDNKVSKYEARVLKELILADGHMSEEERQFLTEALKKNQFDDQASELLTEVLLRQNN